MWFTPLASPIDMAILDYAAAGGGTGTNQGFEGMSEGKEFVKL